MFKSLLSLILVSLCVFQATAQDETKKFRFKPDKVAVGTVYHYVKTNIDGTHPEQISQYVAAQDRLEVFKFHPKGSRAGLVIAQMDWKIFSAKGLESWQVFPSGEKKLFATLNYNQADKKVEVNFPALGKGGETTAIKHLPFHVYNFDLASLNLAFPHLVNPKGSFVIGLADPTFKESPAFMYRGEATVKYVGEERRNDVLCRKYNIDGTGLENRGGAIWVNKTGGYIEDIEIDLPDNPDWKNFKFRLLKVEKMNRGEWEAFMKKQF